MEIIIGGLVTIFVAVLGYVVGLRKNNSEVIKNIAEAKKNNAETKKIEIDTRVEETKLFANIKQVLIEQNKITLSQLDKSNQTIIRLEKRIKILEDTIEKMYDSQCIDALNCPNKRTKNGK